MRCSYPVIPGRCKAIHKAAKQHWIASSLALLAMTSGRRLDLIADDEEFDQVHPPKARGQRHVGGIAAGGHYDAADPRLVVAGVEGVPAAGQIDLEPAGEIH